MSEQTINPLPQAQSDFLEVLQAFLQNEDANRLAFMFRGWVVEGGLHGVIAGLTATPTPLIAFPGGFYITETASITYTDNASNWVIASKDTVGDLGGYVRVPGSHYLVAVAVTAPPLPSETIRLMEVTTAAGAITLVLDMRTLFPEFIAGLNPHVRFDGTEPGGIDLKLGEEGGFFVLSKNFGVSDLPVWLSRITWEIPNSSAVFAFFNSLTGARTYTWPDKSGTVAMLSDITSSAFGPGTRMVFDQDAAPIGWVRDVSGTLNDRVIRIVSGARVDGGSWTITGLSTTHLHGLGGHQHNAPIHSAAPGTRFFGTPMPFGDGDIAGSPLSNPGGASGPVPGNYALTSAPIAATPNTDPTAAPLASDGAWRPLNRAMIVCVKS